MQSVCSIECAAEEARAKREAKAAKAAREDRRETREKLAAMRTRPQLTAAAQTAFNLWVRTRDRGNLCISCGEPLQGPAVGGGYDCGHFRSVGSAAHLRFDERNAHGQCKHCNNYLAGNPHGYRLGLIARIGQAEVEALEADQEPRHYSRDDLIELAKRYRKMARELAKRDAT